MSAEIETYTPRVQASLPAKVQYARELANSGLLPSVYRKQPSNVLYAIEYGDMLGLSPMAAITGVHIIEGKPSASSGLISALVRRAGHKLRVTGTSKSATCQIIRCDDPEYTFEVTFSMDDARTAGLTGKSVWKQYAASMLKARAITQCARDACEEALFGLHYTPEELGAEVDGDGNVIAGEVLSEASEPPAGEQAAPAEPSWLDTALEASLTFTDEAAGQKLWAEVVAEKKAQRISIAEADNLKARITERWRELAAAPVEGTVVEPLDPADPWAAKIEEIASADDAEAVRQEALRAFGDTAATDPKARLVISAIEIKAERLSRAGQAAA